MLDEKLLTQYHELLGNEGVQEMYEAFASNIGGYVDYLTRLIKARDEEQTRSQAHKVKGACRTLGLRQLAANMEWLEREEWHWDQVDDMLAQWVLELPLHQHQLRHWLKARGIE
ncbi:MAG: Hpt domain-containing protein [Pseudidiomarina maritima]|uniref:Hpt domain-containing protein n=1 Tax=Pseudidiomarina sp. PP-1MA TaxID=3237706 RepID=A0AB39XAK6_9GAMM|nr:Hpt domain-containing protein [Pseudidiomarina maritima]